jgi:hypothetical protein
MAQTSTPPIASSLMDINDWIKEKDEIEILNNSVSAPTIVKGRPTRGSLVAPKKTPTLLPPVEVDFGGKNWVGLLLGMEAHETPSLSIQAAETAKNLRITLENN